MRVLWFANTINIVLGPTLIFGLGPFPEMGVVGAAHGDDHRARLRRAVPAAAPDPTGRAAASRREHWRLDPRPCAPSCAFPAPRRSETSSPRHHGWASSRFCPVSAAPPWPGNTIGIRIVLFALLPSFGVSNAAATLVGQNLGAGRPDRAEAAAWKAGLYNTMCLGVVGVIFLVFAPLLIGIFASDPEVAPYGIRCLRIVAAGFFFYGYGMVLTQAFNGAGDTRTPTWINLFCLWLWEFRWPGRCLPRPGSDGRVRGGQRGVLDAGARQRLDLLERDVEDEAGIAPARRASAPRCRSDRRLDVRRERAAGPRSPKTPC